MRCRKLANQHALQIFHSFAPRSAAEKGFHCSSLIAPDDATCPCFGRAAKNNKWPDSANEDDDGQKVLGAAGRQDLFHRPFIDLFQNSPASVGKVNGL